MLNPKSEIVLSKEMLDLMVEYYIASYDNFDVQDLVVLLNLNRDVQDLIVIHLNRDVQDLIVVHLNRDVQDLVVVLCIIYSYGRDSIIPVQIFFADLYL